MALAVSTTSAAGLESLQGTWPELGLKSSLVAPSSVQVEEGSDLQIRLATSLTASIAVGLEDATHKVRLHTLGRPDSGDQLVPGSEMLYPDLGYGETFYADVPTGKAVIWVIASDRTIFQPDNPAAMSRTPALESDALEKQIERARAEGLLSKVTVVRIPIEVVAPAAKEFVSKQDFVSFYAVRTRSVTNADRGFRIGFKHNSAELDDWSRKQLEAVGEGMRDPQLTGYRFAIEGHTDDTGSAQYNLDLSLRRAQAVGDFLAQQTHVPAARLSTKGFGKTQPASVGTDEAARAQNRRVVIRRLDQSAP
jgi:outer membrane protein OmpA-like peptidoglycan-associated protein